MSKGSGGNTCVLVRLLFCGTCGLATVLLPRTKSQSMGCVHNGGASSTPMSDTASGYSPLLSHCLSWCPRPTLLPWKACTIGGRLYPMVNSLLWNNLSPGRQSMAGKTACAKDGTQAAIGIHLKSTLLSFCPVFCFVFVLFCLFGCFLCVLLFVVFVSFAFLLVCARSRQLDSFMDYVKVHTSSLLWLFMHINSISGKLKLV